MDADIAIIVNQNGEVEESRDIKTGKILSHIFVNKGSYEYEEMVSIFGKLGVHDDKEIKYIASIPITIGTCYVFDKYDYVCPSVFGIGLQSYCEGYTMVEITGKNGKILDDRILKSLEFEMNTVFHAFDHVNAPGLLQTQQEFDDLSIMISPFNRDGDPLLKEYSEDWKKTWIVGLSQSHNHFVGVYKTDWNGVHPSIRKNTGHTIQIHYYIVVRGGLPESTSEQLSWLMKTKKTSWEMSIGPKTCVSHAVEMAKHARNTLLDRALEILDVEESGERVHMEWNVLEHANYIDGESGGLEERLAYYNRCTSASKSQSGILTVKDASAQNDGIIWLHGSTAIANRIGGTAFSNSSMANAMPIFMGDDFGRNYNELERYGYKESWGQCELVPLYVIS